MPRPQLRDSQTGFSGLNITSAEDQLGPTEVRQAANVKYTQYGGATKRFGTQRVHTSALTAAQAVQGGYYWDTQGLHIVACNGTLYSSPWGAFPMTWTQLGAANFFSTSTKVSIQAFTSAANPGVPEVLYIADGGKVAIWNGTTLARLATVGTPTAITYLAVQNERLFGVDGTTTSLYYSSLASGDDIGVPSTPAAGGNAAIRTFGESSLQSLLPIGAGLVILHKRGTSTFTGWGQNDISISSGTAGISADIGSISPFGNIAIENNGFVVSDRGIYQLNPLGIYQQISKPIESVLNSLPRTAFPQIVAGHDKNQRQVMFFLPGIGCYVWNYRTEGWSGPWDSTYANPGTTALWAGVDSTNTPIVVGGFGDGFVRQCEAPSFYKDDVHADGTAGTNYTMVLQSRRLLANENVDPFSEKMFRFVMVEATPPASGTASLQWSTSNATFSVNLPQSGGAIWNQFTWGNAQWGAAASAPYRFQGAGRGKYLNMAVIDSGGAASVYSRFDVTAYDYGTSRYSIAGVG